MPGTGTVLGGFFILKFSIVLYRLTGVVRMKPVEQTCARASNMHSGRLLQNSVWIPMSAIGSVM